MYVDHHVNSIFIFGGRDRIYHSQCLMPAWQSDKSGLWWEIRCYAACCVGNKEIKCNRKLNVVIPMNA